MNHRPMIGTLAAAALVGAAAFDIDSGGYSRTQSKRDAERRQYPAPTDPVPLTRQVRRARERAALKSPHRWDGKGLS